MPDKQTSGRKKLTPEQKQLYKEKGIIPDDWWNYGINPILGYRNHQVVIPKIIGNTHPVPDKLKD